MKSADQTVLILRRKVTWITLHTFTQPEWSHESSKLVFSFSSQVEEKKLYEANGISKELYNVALTISRLISWLLDELAMKFE